jgi:tetratricopeptide (TPR) repeat protein
VPPGEEAEDPGDLLGFGPEEQFLLERLRQPMTLGEIMAESPIDLEMTQQRLVQLLGVRRVRVFERAAPAAAAAPAHDGAVVQSLSNRFARHLKEEPLELAPEEFKARVAELFARLGTMNHYELLDVNPSLPVEGVQARYETLARQVHPANEAAYGLTGLKPMLEVLFERATQAFLVLSDPERRRKYNQAEAIDLTASQVTGVQRKAESQELAAKYFEQAQALVARGDFHYAIELLQMASKLDHRAEYYLALARAELKNPKWLPRALDSCRAALDADPHNADARFLLGEIFESQGDLERARAQFSAALREHPGHSQASAKLTLLAGPKTARPEAEGGLFGRIFRRRDG